MKRILNIVFTILLLAGVFVLLGFIRQEHSTMVCVSQEIDLRYINQDTLITKAEIRELIKEKLGAPEGRVLTAGDIAQIRDEILKTHYIENCDIDLTLDGLLRIRAVQRVPAVKVMFGSEAWYVDNKGVVMSLSKNHPHRLLIINSDILQPDQLKPGINLQMMAENMPVFRSSSLYQAVQVGLYIHDDDFLQSLIEQIFINHNDELELYTHVGRQRILFGDGFEAENKLDRLVKFYRSEKAIQNLDLYKTINLKYNKQVVCSKI
ncbi:MAG TPA: hypothetical protein PK908_02800 [Bacteroidales bacterium]|nr:hypothetical protein [Bacteroidales bacterium]